MEGIHSRTDFDLSNHQEYSKKKMQYFDNDLNENGKPIGNYIPYVVETSIGLDQFVPNRYKRLLMLKKNGQKKMEQKTAVLC